MHSISLGPEGYYLKRNREGGTSQSGDLWGAHYLYNRFCTNSLYVAVEGYYTEGGLRGKTGSGAPLRSSMTECEVEGALGYTWEVSWLPRLSLTPFGGYGYFQSDNRFHHPSPLSIQVRDEFDYTMGGLLALWQINDCLNGGIRFKAKWMTDAKSTIFDDPIHGNIKMIIENEWQYEFDFPFNFYFDWRGKEFEASLIPFYRFRHYGGRENFPFNFLETKIKNYGARILFSYIL